MLDACAGGIKQVATAGPIFGIGVGGPFGSGVLKGAQVGKGAAAVSCWAIATAESVASSTTNVGSSAVAMAPNACTVASVTSLRNTQSLLELKTEREIPSLSM